MLEFNAERHEYRYNGVIVPSVTGIISAVGLYDFDHVSRETLKIAAERGTIVHQCVEWHEAEILDPDSIDPELRGYFDAYLMLKDRGDLPSKPDATEERVYSVTYLYAGTLDQRFGCDWINDIKTGQPDPAHGLQLSAYWLAIQSDMRIKPRRLTGTYLRPDGTGTVIDYKYEPLSWMGVLADYNWRAANNKIKSRWK